MPFTPWHEDPAFGTVATWEEWRAATARTLPEFFQQWFYSQLLGFVLLWTAIAGFPGLVRRAWGLLMILAALVNTYASIMDPTCYIDYGVVAVPPMQHFIYSRLFASPALLVLPIAIGQLVIGLVLFLSEEPSLLKKGLTGAMVWFFGVSTLGFGSGFPATWIFASTMMLCWPPPPPQPSSSATARKDKGA
mmetsp:Transcript_26239/g.56863  ORF Transcript_26239/g.56863 Transcript_26239/m.56863 type:complete len:191 (-) Transcript_26239:132-704(-)